LSSPGAYRPDATEGIDNIHDLPTPHRRKQQRNRQFAHCPHCQKRSPRRRTVKRLLRDIGNHETGKPVEIEFTCSVHRCCDCEKYFNIDITDIAEPGSLYTKRVVDMAIRYVIEDGSPLRDACWRLWRDHRVFVPFSTIQNWIEAAGKKPTPSLKPTSILTGHSRTFQVTSPLMKSMMVHFVFSRSSTIAPTSDYCIACCLTIRRAKIFWSCFWRSKRFLSIEN
jgi:transcription elongation factor Elf1